MKSYIQHYNIFQLIKNSFLIYFHFFFSLIGIMAFFQLIPILYLIIITKGEIDMSIIFYSAFELFFIPFYLYDLNIGLVIGIIIYMFCTFLSYFAVVGEISEICLGSSISIKKAISRVRFRGVFRLIGTQFLVVIIFLLLSLPLLVVYMFIEDFEIIFIITLLIFALLYLFLLIQFFFLGQVIILERKYWVQALLRSASLIRSYFLKIAFYIVVLYILMFVMFFLFLFFYFIFFSDNYEIPNILLMMFGLIIAPIPHIFITLFYYSLRIEKHDLTKEDITEIKTFEAI